MRRRHNVGRASGAAFRQAARQDFARIGVGQNDLGAAHRAADELRALRKDMNAISYSRLMRDKTMQPIYYQSLMRLRAKIVARRKKSQ